MTKRSAGKAPSARQKKAELFGWALKSYLAEATVSAKGKNGEDGHIYYLGDECNIEAFSKRLSRHVADWQLDRTFKKERELSYLAGSEGPIWIARPKRTREAELKRDEGLLVASAYSKARDLMGALLGHTETHELEALSIHFEGASDLEKLGALVGLELASYHFIKSRDVRKAKPPLPRLVLNDVSDSLVRQAAAIGKSVNIARHLVNVPGGELNPRTYSEQVVGLFKGHAGVSVEVWDKTRLKKEKMGLLLGVGGGASEGPRLVHIRYRPEGRSKAKKSPIAFVGKGITFDSGGLDIKPSDGMRLMKKDMGGSAALIGLAHWAVTSGYGMPLDFYVALAENAVDQASYRPGDILKSRNGLTVEIHNTDAEGRLALADALDVAITQKNKDEPECVIDVATLTGAVKVGLGMDLAGLFANDDELARALLKAGQAYGDKLWRMPLHSAYENQLKSHVADISNCSPSRFAGAITAALFLERFVGQKPWAHLDIYAWADQASGALREPGGSGQAVQCLIGFLENR